mgnify:CR=1 FL=1
MIKSVPDPSIGIPDGSTQQESRSVLKDKIVSNGLPHSLTVLPAYGMDGHKTTTAVSKPVVSKRALSWAEIASKPTNTRVEKSSLFLRNFT